MAYEQRHLFYRYAPTTTGTTLTYGRLNPISQRSKAIATAGSVTTVTSVNTDSPFFDLVVGDILVFYLSESNVQYRRVSAIATPNSITVAGLGADTSAIDLGTALTAWERWPFISGTGVTNGWVITDRYGPNKTVKFTVDSLTGVTGGFNFQIEGKHYREASVHTSAPAVIMPVINLAAVTGPANTNQSIFTIGEDVAAIRVGVSAGSVAGATSELTVTLLGEPRAR